MFQHILKKTFAEGSNCSSIGSNAFFHCPYLTSIDFSNVTELNLYTSCFAECSSLKTIYSPSGLQSIYHFAFKNCTSLTSVSFSKSLTTIAPGVFDNCPNLSSITWDAWAGNTNLSSTSFSGVCPTGGTVTVTNPSGHESDELLQYLLDNGGLPESWAKPITLPENVYKIDENNVLWGFTDEFLANPTAYERYNTMEIPAKVTSIAHNAFLKDSATTIPPFITKLTFAEGSSCSSMSAPFIYSPLKIADLSNISNSLWISPICFKECSELTSVIFPENLAIIENNAFLECSKLNDIKWKSWTGNTNLNSTSFSGVCPTGGTVTVINPSGHDSDELLQYLLDNGGLPSTWAKDVAPANALPYEVYEIDENNVLLGFKGGINLSQYDDGICDTMQIPANVTSVNQEAFYKDSATTIPSFIKNLTFANSSNLSIINGSAFYSCSSLTSVDLSHTNLTTLEKNGAFAACSSLKTIHFPISLTTIGEKTFEYDTALETITLPEALTTIGNYAFYNCSSLTSIAFPSSLTTIGISAFQECSALTSVGFPNYTNLTTINDRTFLNCSKLTSIDLSNNTNLTTIGISAFEECSELTSIAFPSSLITIKSNAFQECSKLNDIKWKSWTGNTNLNSTSFSGVCPTGGTVTVTNPSGHDSDELLQYLLDNGGLPSTWAKIPLPEDVYNIDENNVLLGFKQDIDLNQYDGTCNTIEIPARVTSIGDRAFYSGSGSTIPDFIKKLTFAEGSNCSTIGYSTFAWGDSLTSITLPSGLTTIGRGAFLQCSSFTSITFPSSLTKIDHSGLVGCNKLNCIEWNLPTNYQSSITISDYAFSQISSTGTVKSLNPSISSQELLNWIKTKGSFPSTGWGPAD